MMDRGYVTLEHKKEVLEFEEYQPRKKGTWFEELMSIAFQLYKKAILKYSLEEYYYLQLQWTGQGFALGMTTTPKKDYWEYIEKGDFEAQEWGLIPVYREIEKILDEDETGYESEIERDEWPKDEGDLYELEYFLLYTILALTYQQLAKDKDLKPYFLRLKRRLLWQQIDI